MEEFSLSDAREVADSLLANLRKVIVGNEEELHLGVMALLCQGHVLIDGVPGVGKTIFAKSIALSLGGTFKRIQCTSDLLPTDITGAYIFYQRDREYVVRAGEVVIVDEFTGRLMEGRRYSDGITRPSRPKRASRSSGRPSPTRPSRCRTTSGSTASCPA